MTDDARPSAQVLGSLRTAGDKGFIRIEHRLDAGIETVWSALTDPARLARWYGEIKGDLRLGGEYHAHLHASGWEGTAHVAECEAPHRLVVSGKEPDDPTEHATAITLTSVVDETATTGEATTVVVEQSGVPAHLVAAFGAGMQIHVEDLAAHVAGGERCDADARWHELEPAYSRLDVERG